MSTIFISYRRSDSEDVTGRIYDRLVQSFRRSAVFKDVSSIPVGMDFREAIQQAISSANVVVAVIGKGWLDAKLEDGSRRIDDPDDFLRIELETALEHRIQIVPVLLGSTKMPDAEDLPTSLQPIAYLHALPIRPDPDFNNDVGRLVRALRDILGEKATPRRVWILSVLLLLLGSISGLLFYQNIHTDTPSSPPSIQKEIPSSTENREAEPSKTVLQERITPGPPSLEEQEEVPSSTEGREEEPPKAVRPEPIIPYDPNFLGKVQIPLPVITDEVSAGDFLDGKVFDYTHYSLVMNEPRAMALFAAFNIDGTRYVRVSRGQDRWNLDPRIPPSLQKGSDLYARNEWDRGHLVTRSAVTWGSPEEAQAASLAAFFYSNSVPQHQRFNQGIWSKLEQYILDFVREEDIRASVYTGPVSRPTDYEYRGSRVPQSFWKIVAYADPKKPRNIFVYAYLMDQYTWASDGTMRTDLPEYSAKFDPKAYQVSVERIESLTPLRFGILKDFDVSK